MAMRVLLHVYEKEKKVSLITIQGTQGRLTMGWESDNDLQVKSLSVSKHSCILHIQEGKVLFKAIVTKKAFVNQQPLGMQSSDMKDYLNKVELQNGDVFTLGNTIHFYVEIMDDSVVEKKCIQCGAVFCASEGEELCFSCRYEIAKSLGAGFDRKVEQSPIGTFASYKKQDLLVSVENLKGKRIRYNARIEKKESVSQQETPQPQPQPAAVTGDIIPGYKELKRIGAGGMGEVYLVEERTTGREMALKRIIPENAVNQAAIDKFVREAYIHCQLDHKNVAKVYKAEPFENTPYILMEYYKEGTIVDYVNKNRKNPQILSLLKDAWIQILEGLDYLHNAKMQVYTKDHYEEPIQVKGLVHRDIKPENIFVEYDSKGKAIMKIADMGLAKSYVMAGLSGVTQGAGPFGTYPLMCRQQIQNTLKSKPEVDIWAAAATIYLLMTGRVPKPIEAEDGPVEMVGKILKYKSVPIRMYNPYVPESLAQIMDRVLDDQGSLYYQNAKELIKDLKKVK